MAIFPRGSPIENLRRLEECLDFTYSAQCGFEGRGQFKRRGLFDANGEICMSMPRHSHSVPDIQATLDRADNSNRLSPPRSQTKTHYINVPVSCLTNSTASPATSMYRSGSGYSTDTIDLTETDSSVIMDIFGRVYHTKTSLAAHIEPFSPQHVSNGPYIPIQEVSTIPQKLQPQQPVLRKMMTLNMPHAPIIFHKSDSVESAMAETSSDKCDKRSKKRH